MDARDEAIKILYRREQGLAADAEVDVPPGHAYRLGKIVDQDGHAVKYPRPKGSTIERRPPMLGWALLLFTTFPAIGWCFGVTHAWQLGKDLMLGQIVGCGSGLALAAIILLGALMQPPGRRD